MFTPLKLCCATSGEAAAALLVCWHSSVNYEQILHQVLTQGTATVTGAPSLQLLLGQTSPEKAAQAWLVSVKSSLVWALHFVISINIRNYQFRAV